MQIVVHAAQPPPSGVSAGESGCGWWAYASRCAPARPMPRMKSTGDTPPDAPRGAVAPPAIGGLRDDVLDRGAARVEELRDVERG